MVCPLTVRPLNGNERWSMLAQMDADLLLGMVGCGMNQSNNRMLKAFVGSAAPLVHRSSQDSNRSGSSEHITVNGLKKEVPTSQSPTLGAIQPNGGTTRSIEARPSPGVVMSNMPPPPGVTQTPRYPSGSPHPQATGLNNNVPNHHAPVSAIDSRLRQPGKGES